MAAEADGERGGMKSVLRLVKYMTPEERRRYEARLLEYVRKVCREGGREVYENGDLVPVKDREPQPEDFR